MLEAKIVNYLLADLKKIFYIINGQGFLEIVDEYAKADP